MRLPTTHNLAEEFIKYCINYALEHCEDDIRFLNDHFDKELVDRLKFVVENDFVRLPYTEGVKILEESGKKFEFPCIGALTLLQSMSVSSWRNISRSL